MKYPFSRECEVFENILAKIMYNGKITGVVFLTNRNGLFRIPYVYADSSQSNPVFFAVCKMLIEKNASGFCTFRRDITEYIEKNAFPCFYKKCIIKELAISKAIIQKQPEKYFLQDGDGDVVFT